MRRRGKQSIFMEFNFFTSQNSEKFEFNGWPVHIEYVPRFRKMTMALRPGKPIKIRTGRWATNRDVIAFLEEKKSWIAKHMTEFERVARENPKPKLVVGEEYPYIGEKRKLEITLTPLKRGFVSVTDQALRLHYPQDKWREGSEQESHEEFSDLVKQFYKREAIKMMSERVEYWAQEMNLHPRQVRFRNQRTRWGSCSTRKTISLNWRLIAAPLEIIDYVIIHELAHLEHHNHSKNFWSLVEKFCPDYRASEKWLYTDHHSLDFLIEESSSDN